MVEGDCKHEMPAAWCGICTPHTTAVDAVHQVEIRYEFLARFDGVCPTCRRAVHQGDPMGRTTEKELVCGACPGVELTIG